MNEGLRPFATALSQRSVIPFSFLVFPDVLGVCARAHKVFFSKTFQSIFAEAPEA